jgi:hypothetical protein
MSTFYTTRAGEIINATQIVKINKHGVAHMVDGSMHPLTQVTVDAIESGGVLNGVSIEDGNVFISARFESVDHVAEHCLNDDGDTAIVAVLKSGARMAIDQASATAFGASLIDMREAEAGRANYLAHSDPAIERAAEQAVGAMRKAG